MVLLRRRCLVGVVTLQTFLQTPSKEGTAREYENLKETKLEEEASITEILIDCWTSRPHVTLVKHHGASSFGQGMSYPKHRAKSTSWASARYQYCHLTG